MSFLVVKPFIVEKDEGHSRARSRRTESEGERYTATTTIHVDTLAIR